VTPEDRELRVRARQAIATALRRGVISRQPCEVCGEARSQAHHAAGYEPDQWLVVRWLCRRHHVAAHWVERSQRATRRLRWIDIREETGWRDRVAAAARR
jgi:sarcosine oxidase gamma subunit